MLCPSPLIGTYTALADRPSSPAFNSPFIAEPLNAVGSVTTLFQTQPPIDARLENLIGCPSTGAFHPIA